MVWGIFIYTRKLVRGSQLPSSAITHSQGSIMQHSLEVKSCHDENCFVDAEPMIVRTPMSSEGGIH